MNTVRDQSGLPRIAPAHSPATGKEPATGGSFADLLRRFRRNAGLTQEELAERSGVSTRAISNLERELNQRPHRETVVMLADGLALATTERDRLLAAARMRPEIAAIRVPGGSQPAPSAPADALFGRERELRAVTAALGRRGERLLTLTGPSGVGKTRLALAVCDELAGQFADGVHFIRLDGLTDPTLVLPTIAATLNLQESGSKLALADRLAEHLADVDALLVLDNMEHLLAAAPQIANLVQRTARLHILGTSREALRVRGEQLFPIAPLPRPDPETWTEPGALLDSPAVALFVQRALAGRPDLETDPSMPGGRHNLAAISEICHRLDGLPLAIELAAAQIQALSPGALLALMNGAGLPLLAAGGRDQPARLQTMTAAIAWSYNVLAPEEQATFRALSVFAGGFSLPAAAAIVEPSNGASLAARDPLVWHGSALGAVIASLAAKNLLVQDTLVPDHAAPRFRMLEPIRLFGLDRLREADEEWAVRQRHATFFAQLAERLDALTLGPSAEVWIQRLGLDLDNIRTAHDWSLASREHELAVHIVCGAAQFWEIKGLLSDARRRVAATIAIDAASPPARRWLLRYWAGIFAFHAGEIEEAISEAHKLLTIAEAHDEPLGVGVGLAQLSRAIGSYPDRHEEAADLARRAVAVLEPLGQDEWTGSAWSRLGAEYHWLGQLQGAHDSITRGLVCRRRKRCEVCAAYSLVSLGLVLTDLKEPLAALAAYRESLASATHSEDRTAILAALLGLADLVWRFGNEPDRYRSALLLFGMADGLLRATGFGQTPSAQEAIARWQEPMRAALGNGQVTQLIEQGKQLPTRAVGPLLDGLDLSGHAYQPGGQGPESLLLATIGSID